MTAVMSPGFDFANFPIFADPLATFSNAFENPGLLRGLIIDENQEERKV